MEVNDQFTFQLLYPREKSPGMHWIEEWVRSIAGLDAVEKKKSFWLYRESIPSSSIAHPLA
jgi:hypothetical protein